MYFYENQNSEILLIKDTIEQMAHIVIYPNHILIKCSCTEGTEGTEGTENKSSNLYEHPCRYAMYFINYNLAYHYPNGYYTSVNERDEQVCEECFNKIIYFHQVNKYHLIYK